MLSRNTIPRALFRTHPLVTHARARTFFFARPPEGIIARCQFVERERERGAAGAAWTTVNSSEARVESANYTVPVVFHGARDARKNAAAGGESGSACGEGSKTTAFFFPLVADGEEDEGEEARGETFSSG